MLADRQALRKSVSSMLSSWWTSFGGRRGDNDGISSGRGPLHGTLPQVDGRYLPRVRCCCSGSFRLCILRSGVRKNYIDLDPDLDAALATGGFGSTRPVGA